jgi:hypothetical protein
MVLTFTTIPVHYSKERLKYLKVVLNNFLVNYKLTVDVFIDTNSSELNLTSWIMNKGSVAVFVHNKLSHPFHLTCMHKLHMKREIKNYKYFMYIEDDMYLPYINFQNYILNFSFLYPTGIPSFIRIEYKAGEKFITDITERQQLKKIILYGREFTQLKQPYHAFWIMPGEILKETINENFTQLTDSRELSASYPMWQLEKKPYVEIVNDKISELCYSYHLPNNYANELNTPHAKIKPDEVFY